MAAKRKARRASPKKRRQRRKEPRKKQPRRPRSPRRPKHPRSRSKKPRDWRAKVNRREILQSLKKISGRLAGALQRAALNDHEAIYLRGIANLRGKKKLTGAQKLMIGAALRHWGPLKSVMLTKREQKLAMAFKRAETKTSKRHLPGFWAVLKNFLLKGQQIFYRELKTGAVVSFSPDGFLRFISRPQYKKRRDALLKIGRFYLARPDASGSLPKDPKKRQRIPVL